MAMARKVALSRNEMVYGMWPEYLRYNLWDNEGKDDTSVLFAPLDLVDWTEVMKPLPTVPFYKLINMKVMKTIEDTPVAAIFMYDLLLVAYQTWCIQDINCSSGQLPQTANL